jgi:hypothetical protein
MTPSEAAHFISRELENQVSTLRVIADREFPSRVTLELCGDFDTVAAARDYITTMKRSGQLGTLTIERWPTEEVAPGEHRDRFEISNVVVVNP